MATSHSQQGDYSFLQVDLFLSVGIWENGELEWQNEYTLEYTLSQKHI